MSGFHHGRTENEFTTRIPPRAYAMEATSSAEMAELHGGTASVADVLKSFESVRFSTVLGDFGRADSYYRVGGVSEVSFMAYVELNDKLGPEEIRRSEVGLAFGRAAWWRFSRQWWAPWPVEAIPPDDDFPMDAPPEGFR